MSVRPPDTNRAQDETSPLPQAGPSIPITAVRALHDEIGFPMGECLAALRRFKGDPGKAREYLQQPRRIPSSFI
jgi:hypothetical protein